MLWPAELLWLTPLGASGVKLLFSVLFCDVTAEFFGGFWGRRREVEPFFSTMAKTRPLKWQFLILLPTINAIYKNQKSSKHQILLKNFSFGISVVAIWLEAFSNNLWKIPFQIGKFFALLEKDGSGNLVVQ